MPQLSEAGSVELTLAFQTRLKKIAARAGTVSKRSFLGLSGWDRANIAEFIDAAGPALSAAGGASLTLSTGFYGLLTGVPSVGLLALVSSPNYEAPFTAYWSSLKDMEWADAINVGADRAMSIGSDYVTLVSREVAGVAAPNAAGFRRVPRREACGWCLTVATQRYHTAESANFGHDHCGCLVVPIDADRDPGQVINRMHRDEIELPTE